MPFLFKLVTMKTANLLLALAFCLATISCTQKKGQVNMTANNVESLDFGKIKADSDIPSLQYETEFIKLETSDSCLINNVGQIEYKNDTLFVLDDSTLKLLAFNKQGTFLQAIGKKGNGPGEYTLPVSIFLNEKEATLYVIDAGQQKLIEFNANTFGFKKEHKLPFNSSCVCSLNDGQHLVWNDNQYQDTETAYHFLTTNSNLNVENHYVEKEFKSGYITAPAVSLFKSGPHIYGYTPFSPVIYELTADECRAKYGVKYGDYEFPSVSYMNEISNKGTSSYFNKLEMSGLISYNKMLGNKHCLLSCFMVNKSKYIGCYNLQSKKGDVYLLDDFARTLQCGQFEYAATSIKADRFALVMSSGALKHLETERYAYCDRLKPIVNKTSEEDNPIICLLTIK